MKKTLYILYCIALSLSLLAFSGCMKGNQDVIPPNDDKNGDPPDDPGPITPSNPNGKQLIEPDFSVAEPVISPGISTAKPDK